MLKHYFTVSYRRLT